MRFDSNDILCLMICFLVFAVLQALFINGVHELFKGGCVNDLIKGKICNGNLGYKLGQPFFEKHKSKTWAMPLWGCVKCQSSVWGAFTFWPVVLVLFGYDWKEIPVSVFDMIILIPLNYYIYKKV